MMESMLNMMQQMMSDMMKPEEKDRTVALYDGTGALAAQAGFALRLLGYRNVVVLHGGFLESKKVH